MVYNGPSTGCLTCRKRKVRCDKGRPECNNCLKRKQKCPGYGDVFDTRHRDQTQTIIARADSKSGIISNKAHLLTPGTSPANSSPRTTCTRTSPPLELTMNHVAGSASQQNVVFPLMFNLPVNLEASALSFFFESFGRALGDCRAVHGFMPDLGHVYRGASSASPLHAATVSIAMNMFMLFAHQGSDTKQARSFYLKAVSGLKECLAKPDPGDFDELIMAVLALDFYDMINHRFSPIASSNDHHKRGALALLKHRGSMNFSTELSRIMVSHVRTILSHWALEHEIELSTDVIELLNHPSLPSKNQNMLDTLSLRLATLMSKYRNLQKTQQMTIGTTSSPELENLLQAALQLDEDMMDWETKVPARWYPTVLTPVEVEPSIRYAGMWNDRCPVYADLAICDVYNTYRQRRLQLLQLIQKLCMLSKQDSSADIFDYKGHIMQRLVDEICESIPFCLGDASGNKIGSIMDQVKFPTTWKKGQPFPHPSVDHPHSAMASGGWQMYTVFTLLLHYASPVLGLVPLQFRPGQLVWIQRQMERIEGLYGFPPRQR